MSLLAYLSAVGGHDMSFFIKRARTAEMTCGDAAYQRNRFAELRGY